MRTRERVRIKKKMRAGGEICVSGHSRGEGRRWARGDVVKAYDDVRLVNLNNVYSIHDVIFLHCYW
jgi:hypothetical protein